MRWVVCNALLLQLLAMKTYKYIHVDYIKINGSSKHIAFSYRGTLHTQTSLLEFIHTTVCIGYIPVQSFPLPNTVIVAPLF